MKRTAFAIAVMGLLGGIPSAARAATVTLTDWTTGDFATNAPGGGGAFKATTTAGSLLGVGSFVTFCLEFNEHFNYNNSYNFTLSDRAFNGGAGVVPPGGDPVSDATKWLYYTALTSGYATLVTGFGGTLNLSGSYIQEAIWYLEQEKTSAQINAVSLSLANHASLAPQIAQWQTLESQGHRVKAMNLTTIPGGQVVQDQLAYFAVPEAGSTLVLALVGLTVLGVGLARVRRREHEAVNRDLT